MYQELKHENLFVYCFHPTGGRMGSLLLCLFKGRDDSPFTVCGSLNWIGWNFKRRLASAFAYCSKFNDQQND